MIRKRVFSLLTAVVMTAVMLAVPAVGEAFSEKFGLTASAEFVQGNGWLEECLPYLSSNFTTYYRTNSNSFKSEGNEYTEGHYVTLNKSAAAHFNLDGKYDELSFDFTRIENYDRANISFSVMLDGENVDKKEINSSTDTSHISIDLKGAKQLILNINSDKNTAYAMVKGSWKKNGNAGTQVLDSTWFEQCPEYELSGSYWGKKPVRYSGVDSYITMCGKKYTNALAFVTGDPEEFSDRNKSAVIFKLEKRFSNFSFTVGRLDNTYQYNARFSILLDDTEYLTFDVNKYTLPKQYTIPVKNVAKMEIQMIKTEGYGETWYGIGEAYFDSNQKDISTATAKLLQTSYIYDGKAKTPSVTVTYDGKTLVNGTDYTVSYSNNVNIGTATATIKAQGDYAGTLTKTFSIVAADPSSVTEKTSILKAKITLSNKSLTYTGKTRAPKVTVTYNGKTLVKDKDYTLAVKDAVKVGKASLLVIGKGKYTGKGLTYYYIVPVKPTISSVKSSTAKKLTVKWKKNTTATGYQIQVSMKKNFSTKKSYGVSKNSTVKGTISKLTSGKTYYVRMRCYKTIDGVKKYSAYSAVKSVKVK